jgi:hypothetical protein
MRPTIEAAAAAKIAAEIAIGIGIGTMVMAGADAEEAGEDRSTALRLNKTRDDVRSTV